MRKVLSVVTKAIDEVAIFAGNLSALFILAMAFCTGYEVLARTLFNKPTSWTLELSIHLTIGATFLGAAYVAEKGRHIKVDIVTSRLCRKVQNALDFTMHLFSLVVCAAFLYGSVKLVKLSGITHAVTPALQLPLYLPQMTMVIGLSLLLLQLMKITAQGVKLLKQPIEDGWASILRSGITVAILAIGMGAGCFMIRSGGTLAYAGVILLIFAFLLSGLPIFLGLIAVAGIGFLVNTPRPLHSLLPLGVVGYASLNKFELTAIPLFILGGGLIAATKMSDRLFDFLEIWTSRIPGSLAIASILSCAVFAAMCGSGISGALTIGIVAIPAMVERGYDKKLAIGSVASAGTLGLLIPPSIAMIVYGALTDVSVGKLFIGGIFPGILIAALLCLYVIFKCRNDPRYRSYTSPSWQEKSQALLRAIPVLVIPIFLLGTIYTGTATPTEAASLLVIWALVLGLIFKRLSLANFWESLRDSLIASSALLMIFVGAKILNHLAAQIQLPQAIVNLTTGLGLPGWGIIALINFIIILLGMIFESGALMMILTPILYPLVVSLGYDPLWFGILFVINIEIAQISPPVGIVLYALQSVLQEKMELVMKAAIPFALLLILGLVIVGLCPPIATWLPSKMIH